ncbi:hypothetical protein [Paraferrimonas sp. SM1919]|uniref:hypothetical protein n=1 Tax=Paraferrimonas sp. SM1919 TaxID=2662263 RepID=UPI0013D7E8EB|nr:hypothetical protein [Paraferrimonas sp. SM1919]
MQLSEVFNSPKGVRWLTQGNYGYVHNGNKFDICERWRQGVNFKGETYIQSFRYSAMASSMLKVQSCVDRQGASKIIIEFECGDLDKIITHVQGSAERWIWQKTDATGAVLESGEFQQGIFFPLLRIFEGAIIEALKQSPATLILPDIRLSAKPSQKLSLYSETRHSFEVAPLSKHQGAHFRFIGGEYDADNAYFVVRDHLLQFYQWQTQSMGTWQVSLDWKKL